MVFALWHPPWVGCGVHVRGGKLWAYAGEPKILLLFSELDKPIDQHEATYIIHSLRCSLDQRTFTSGAYFTYRIMQIVSIYALVLGLVYMVTFIFIRDRYQVFCHKVEGAVASRHVSLHCNFVWCFLEFEHSCFLLQSGKKCQICEDIERIHMYWKFYCSWRHWIR